MVEHERVPVGVPEIRHVTDPAVDRLGRELDAPLLEVGTRLVHVVDVQRDRMRMGLELEPEGVGLKSRVGTAMRSTPVTFTALDRSLHP